MNYDEFSDSRKPDPALVPAPASEGAQLVARAFAGVSISLNVVVLGLFLARLYTRTFPIFRLGWDDYLISVAYCLTLTSTVLLLNAIPYVMGRPPESMTLADAERGLRLATIVEPVWAWSMAFIKLSIAAMLLRVEQGKNWRRFLWAMVIILIAVAIYNTVSNALKCVPYKANWDVLRLVKARCWSNDAIRANLITVCSFNIATDVVFALMPITFLRKVQRPLRERIVIGVLLGLGVLASVCSINKAIAAATFGRTNDGRKEGVQIGMWTGLEQQVGFIAACIPCLRSPFQKFLQYFGLMTTKPATYGAGYGQMHGSSAKRFNSARRSEAGYQMKSMRKGDTQSEENILVDEGDAKNGEIWRTTEVHMEERTLNDEDSVIQKPTMTHPSWMER
ncbi:hypothetical protein CC78DRAFT_532411 [Lojkania enalia]|uniref:Rhodopsin domain-containing protein n=1 Tax=Lojkania enalia TaxID=147567 RepID=A0A9P4N8M2_9PLEO|nr:hypothetical protein CC78DRAFT_532411 [Didymosphaeria enalia]